MDAPGRGPATDRKLPDQTDQMNELIQIIPRDAGRTRVVQRPPLAFQTRGSGDSCDNRLIVGPPVEPDPMSLRNSTSFDACSCSERSAPKVRGGSALTPVEPVSTGAERCRSALSPVSTQRKRARSLVASLSHWQAYTSHNC